MAVQAASLMVEFGATGADKVERDINQVRGAADSATRGFSVLGNTIGTAGGFLIGQAITKGISVIRGLGSSLITTSAQAETLGLALETAAGDRARQLYADLQKFAALTPFEFPELAQSVIALENFGIKSNEVIEGVGRNWTEVIGDTAAAMGKTYDQVTQAVLDGVMGENERLKELGIRASYEGDQIKYTYMKNGKEMTAFADRNSQEMIAATIAGIWNDKYEGAMEKQSRSFAGKMATLQDNWSMTMQRLGEGFFDFTKVGLTHANLFFDRFNVGLDRGLNPFEAGVRALKFSLQDVFGKGPVNKIWGGMEGMFGMLATGGRKVIDVASGLKNLSFGIGAAFLDGDRQQFFRQLPGWLQRSAQFAGTIAEGFGDIYRAFRENGIGGAWDALTGGEGQQIWNAVVNVAPKLGAWVWDKGTDAASWLYEEAVALGGWVVNKLPVAIDFFAKWGGIAWGGLTDFASWVKNELPGLIANGVEASLDFVSKWGGIAWGEFGSDFAAWFRKSVGDPLSVSLEAIVTVDAKEAKSAYDSGQEAGSKVSFEWWSGVQAGFDELMTGDFSGLMARARGGADGGSGGFDIVKWLNKFMPIQVNKATLWVAGYAADWGKRLASHMGNVAYQNFVLPPINWGNRIQEWFTGGPAGPTGLYDDFGNEILSAPMSGLDSALADIQGGLGLFIGDLTGSITTFKDDMKGLIEGAFDFGWPEMPGFVTNILDTLDGWIGEIASRLGRLFGLENDVKSREAGGSGVTGPAAFSTNVHTNLGTGQAFMEHPVYGHPLYGDTWNPVAGPFSPGGQSESIVARLDFDTAPAKQKLADLGLGGGYEKSFPGDSAFTAVFDLDTVAAEERKSAAMDWGTAWDESTFAGIFDADNGPAALKYTDAFPWGDTWDRTTFTAKFTVDLGPLEAAKIRVAELAQEISDLLPRSPAKRGPLARPISFDYIRASLNAAMNGMAHDAAAGMAAVGGALGGSGLGAPRRAAGGGNTTIVNVATLRSSEWLEVLRKVERGAAIDLNLARELQVRSVRTVS